MPVFIGGVEQGSGGPAQATQAEIEAQSNVDKYLPPDLVDKHPGIAKVWCKNSADGTSITVSKNIASLTDVGTGVRTYVFDTDFSSADFIVAGAAFQLTALVAVSFDTPAAGSVRALVRDGAIHSSATDPANVDRVNYMVAFGDQ